MRVSLTKRLGADFDDADQKASKIISTLAGSDIYGQNFKASYQSDCYTISR